MNRKAIVSVLALAGFLVATAGGLPSSTAVATCKTCSEADPGTKPPPKPKPKPKRKSTTKAKPATD
jgi:hypothetical protein